MARRPPPVALPVEPRPAATVVLVRLAGDGLEVLLTRRPSTMAFAAGMMVFPGGRVDDADGEPGLLARSSLGPAEAAERLGGTTEPALAAALHVAALRELFEEAGVLIAEPATPRGGLAADAVALAASRAGLVGGGVSFAELVARHDLRLRADLLVPIARWITPVSYPRRFDARFFIAELPPGASPTFIGDEVASHRWVAPGDALDAMARRELEMWIPTSSTLQRLAPVRSFADVGGLAVGRTHPAEVERLDDDTVRVRSWTAGGVPGRPAETLLVGRRELVVVDPGDPSPEVLAEILGIAAGAGRRIVAIAIAGADPDRAAGADELSERTGVAVFGPPGSAAWLPFPVTELPLGGTVPAGDVSVTIGATGR